jgi:hypothetical protein
VNNLYEIGRRRVEEVIVSRRLRGGAVHAIDVESCTDHVFVTECSEEDNHMVWGPTTFGQPSCSRCEAALARKHGLRRLR